jgi:hypothetical protein
MSGRNLVLFVVLVVAELFTSTVGVWLLVDSTSNLPIVVNTISTWIRIPIFLLVSIALDKKWWRLWLRIDFLLAAYLSSAVSYVFTLMSRATSLLIPPNNAWYVAADVSYFL